MRASTGSGVRTNRRCPGRASLPARGNRARSTRAPSPRSGATISRGRRSRDRPSRPPQRGKPGPPAGGARGRASRDESGPVEPAPPRAGRTDLVQDGEGAVELPVLRVEVGRHPDTYARSVVHDDIAGIQLAGDLERVLE